MEITKRIVHRRITEREFLRLKVIPPFDQFRQDSKSINFGFIFGMSFRKFSMSVLETSWKYERVQTFIKEHDLYNEVHKLSEKMENEEPKTIEYFTVSNYIRTQFFETYKGLLERIERNKEFAKDNGYIRSFHGGIRRLPLMMYAFNDEGKPRKDENRKEVSNWTNIAANSTIQTDEVCTANTRINEIRDYIKQNNLDVRVVGAVHDSVDMYVPKENSVPFLLHMKELFEKEEEWAKGVLFLTDVTVCDFNNPEQHYYKHGTPIKKFLEQLEGKVT